MDSASAEDTLYCRRRSHKDVCIPSINDSFLTLTDHPQILLLRVEVRFNGFVVAWNNAIAHSFQCFIHQPIQHLLPSGRTPNSLRSFRSFGSRAICVGEPICSFHFIAAFSPVFPSSLCG